MPTNIPTTYFLKTRQQNPKIRYLVKSVLPTFLYISYHINLCILRLVVTYVPNYNTYNVEMMKLCHA